MNAHIIQAIENRKYLLLRDCVEGRIKSTEYQELLETDLDKLSLKDIE